MLAVAHLKVPKVDGLTPKQQRFVDEYLVDLNATQAALRAGYAASGAAVEGTRLLKNAKVAAIVADRQHARSERLDITKDWVLERLRENVERAMTAEPYRDQKGQPTGEYRYEGHVANKALELLGKHLGMFTDRLDVDLTDLATLTDEEIDRRRRELKLA